MDIVEHCKCKKCNKIKHVSELKNNPSRLGMVCFDDVSCKKEQLKIKNFWRIFMNKKIVSHYHMNFYR